MLSVKFESPIIIDEKNLGALLALAGVAARVEPYVEGAKPGRKPKVVADAPPPSEPAPPEAGQQESTPDKEAVKEPVKRERKPAATKTVDKPAESSDEAETVDGASLLTRFSALIDADFDAARGLLEDFGVAKFSDLAEGDFAAFSNKMSDLETEG